MTNSRKQIVHVAITSDLLCPWCWVGLRKLQEASKRCSDTIDVNITWKPYFLRPNAPLEGIPKADPTPESRVSQHLKQAGQSVGINFTGLCDRTPNTILFHSVMKMLEENEHVDEKTVTLFHEAVFEGYFTVGVFPDEGGLIQAAERVSNLRVLDEISSLFQDSSRLEQLRNQVLHEAMHASRSGVQGVPSFEFNGHREFSGAQPVELFENMLKKYAKD